MEGKAKSRIAVLRERAGLTQLKLSHLVGVTENTIQNWENNRVGFEQIERVIKFCKALNCKPEELIRSISVPEGEPNQEGSCLEELQSLLGADKQSQASANSKPEISVPNIANLRERAGLTQLELSHLVGVTENTIQNCEKGRAGFEQIERVIKFCKALNCKPEELIESISVSEGEPNQGQFLRNNKGC